MQSNTSNSEIQGLDQGQLRSDLDKIAEKNPDGVALFALRVALRIFPLFCDEKGFLFRSDSERHFLACWRAVWIGFRTALGHDVAYAVTADAANAVIAYAADPNHSASYVHAVYAATTTYADTVQAAAAAADTADVAIRQNEFSVVADIRNDLNALKRINSAKDNYKIASQPLWAEKKSPEVDRRITLLEKELEKCGYRNIVEDYRRFLDGSVSEILKEDWRKYESQWEKIEQEYQSDPLLDGKLKADNKKAKPTKNKQESKLSIELETEISGDNEQLQGSEENRAELDKAKAVINHRPGHTYHTDNPGNVDYLNREPLAQSIAQWMLAKENNQHLTLGLFGDWGVGKSTFVELIYKHLGIDNNQESSRDNNQGNKSERDLNPESKKAPEKPEIEYIKGLFNAWRYEHSDNIQAGLAQEAINALTKGLGRWQRLKLTWQFAKRQNKNGLVYVFGCLLVAIGLIIWTLLKGDATYKPWLVITEISIAFGLVYQQSKQLIAHPMAKELNTYLRLPSFGQHLGTIPVMLKQIKTLAELRLNPKEGKRRLLFVVDDLDRCSPGAVVKTLEAVRLVMDIEQVMVIIAIDKRVALASLALHYEKLSEHHGSIPLLIARDYLAKVVHVPITLEDPAPLEIKGFIVDHLWEKDDLQKIAGQEDKSQDFAASDDVSGNNNSGNQLEQNLPEEGKEKEEGEDKKETGLNELKNLDGNSSDLLKPLQEADGKQEEAKIEPIVRYGMSQSQRQVFLSWVEKLCFRNPRQLKRLDNAYRLLRLRYPDEDQPVEETEPFPRLKMLLWLEYVNELSIERRDLLRSHWRGTLDGDEAPDSKDLTLYKEISASIGGEVILDQIYPEVKAFVLPAVDKEDLVKLETAD